MKRYSWKWFVVALLATGFSVTSAPAVPAHDYVALKKNIQVLEGILNTILQQSFTEPFAVLEKPKGVYLDGFGAVFSFEIDIATVKQVTLFSQTRATPDEEKKVFAQRLPKLKEAMEKTLADHGDSLSAMGPEEQIALAAHLFNPGVLGSPLTLKTVIVRTARKNIVEYKAGRLSFDELKKKMEVLQY